MSTLPQPFGVLGVIYWTTSNKKKKKKEKEKETIRETKQTPTRRTPKTMRDIKELRKEIN